MQDGNFCTQHKDLIDGLNDIKNSLNDFHKLIDDRQFVNIRNGTDKRMKVNDVIVLSHNKLNEMQSEIKSIKSDTAFWRDGTKLVQTVSGFMRNHKTTVIVTGVIFLLLLNVINGQDVANWILKTLGIK